MRRTRAWLLPLSVIILFAAPACDPAAPLGRYIHQVIARDVPGIAVIVVDPEKLLFDDSGGFRDVARKKQLAPGDVFRIASMTKPITSLAAMMLHEQGKLDLDAPVTQYLPEFDHLRVITSGVTRDETGPTYESRPPARP